MPTQSSARPTTARPVDTTTAPCPQVPNCNCQAGAVKEIFVERGREGSKRRLGKTVRDCERGVAQLRLLIGCKRCRCVATTTTTTTTTTASTTTAASTTTTDGTTTFKCTDDDKECNCDPNHATEQHYSENGMSKCDAAATPSSWCRARLRQVPMCAQDIDHNKDHDSCQHHHSGKHHQGCQYHSSRQHHHSRQRHHS